MTVATIDQVREWIDDLHEPPEPEPLLPALWALEAERSFRRRHKTTLAAPCVEFEPWDLDEQRAACAPSLETMLHELMNGRAHTLGAVLERKPDRPASLAVADEAAQVVDWDSALIEMTGMRIAEAFAASPLSAARALIPSVDEALTPEESARLLSHARESHKLAQLRAVEIAAEEAANSIMYAEEGQRLAAYYDQLAADNERLRAEGRPYEPISPDVIERVRAGALVAEPISVEEIERPATRAEVEALAEAGWVSDVEAALAHPLMVHERITDVPVRVPDAETERWERHETGELDLTIHGREETWQRFETGSRQLVQSRDVSRPEVGWRASVRRALGRLRDALSRPPHDEPIPSA